MIKLGYTNRLIEVITEMRKEADNLREHDTKTAERIDYWADCMVRALFNIKEEHDA